MKHGEVYTVYRGTKLTTHLVSNLAIRIAGNKAKVLFSSLYRHLSLTLVQSKAGQS